jgi:HEAT repeat protein
MLQQLESKSWIQQAEALHYLGEHRVELAIDDVRALRNDKTVHSWIRGRALLSLSQIVNGVDPGEFGKWVAHDQSALRAAAAEVLELHGGNSATTWIGILLKDADPVVKCHAAAAHARRKKEAAWAVVDQLTTAPTPPLARASARALAFTGNEAALARLGRQLTNPDLMRESLRGISEIQSAVLIPILLNLLPDLEETDLNYGAILTGLQNQEWKEVTAAMAEFIKSGDEKRVRTGARLITTLTRSPELGPPLRAALARANETETIEAGLIALGSAAMNPDEHHQFFSKTLKHEESSIRSLSIRCLAHCREINHYDILRESLVDEDPEVIRAALSALKRQPAVNAPQGRLVAYLEAPLSSDDETVRALAYEVLAHAGSEADFRPAMAALEELLTGTDDILRVAAAKALGALAPEDQIGEVVAAQGYLADWMVIGTFRTDKEHKAFHEVHEPEKEIDFEKTYKATYIWLLEGRSDKPIEREVTWGEGIVDRTDGKLAMSSQLPPPGSFAVGYAVADIHVDTEREVTLDIDGDDAFRIWLNGEKISEKIAPYQHRKDCIAEDKGRQVKLVAGTNRFIVKSANVDYRWWVRLRLTDSNGIPIPFRTP